ncbi:CinA family protein [Tepidiforma sp.]|jgi:PncC family amidohydrolase|uniref:CinA family protein n=1 Tax=Tepidiforma sp. TaxID=2682230 RepID=UPI0026160B5A|nr:CinA family protein [Tepidiforma sp.]MCX7617220.1 CinA family protein [Tepidiforma sp.]
MAGFPLEHDALAAQVGELLAARGEKVAVSETTAGGLISARMLSVPGASRWYDGGIIPYAGAHRWTQLELDVEIARQHGAVSAPWVAATAEGLRKALGCAWALAESGIAGPQGSRRSPKPVGSVVIALAGPAGAVTEEHLFPGSRVEVMAQIAERALRLLREALEAAGPPGG